MTNSTIEAIASLLLLLNVALVARRSMWNYLFGIAAVLLFAFIFWTAKLYAAFGLQFLFLALNLYGLWNWQRALADSDELPIGRLSGRQQAATGIAIAATAALLGFLLHQHTDAASPWWDSLNTSLALAAQYWQARRKVETWVLWICVNIGSVGLYALQSLWFTSGVYAVLLAVALYGLREWRQAETGSR